MVHGLQSNDCRRHIAGKGYTLGTHQDVDRAKVPTFGGEAACNVYIYIYIYPTC